MYDGQSERVLFQEGALFNIARSVASGGAIFAVGVRKNGRENGRCHWCSGGRR